MRNKITKSVGKGTSSHDIHLLVSNLIFTNGSYNSNLSEQEKPMGSGWIITSPAPNPESISFKGTSQYFPSSTKAEIIAIFTALITCPSNSSVTINTDSQAAIDGF